MSGFDNSPRRELVNQLAPLALGLVLAVAGMALVQLLFPDHPGQHCVRSHTVAQGVHVVSACDQWAPDSPGAPAR